MKLDKKAMILYAVTDRKWTGRQSLAKQVESALKGGATCVQLREKNLDYEGFLAEAVEINKLCKKYKVPFIVNDNVEIAIKSGADGVHVGQDDMQAGDVRKKIGDDMILGVSAHNVNEALTAEKNGADYIGAGAVFGTSTKTNVSAMSYDTLKDICSAVSIPVVAIGGINENNISLLKGSGIDGTALVSAVFSAEDIEKKCIELKAVIEDTIKN